MLFDPITARSEWWLGWLRVTGMKTRYLQFEFRFDCQRNQRTRPAQCLSFFQSQISCFGGKPVSLNSELCQYNEISARSRQIWWYLGQILKNMEEYWPDLNRSNQICRDSTRFRPKFGQISTPCSELETDWYAPETDKTRFSHHKFHTS